MKVWSTTQKNKSKFSYLCHRHSNLQNIHDFMYLNQWEGGKELYLTYKFWNEAYKYWGLVVVTKSFHDRWNYDCFYNNHQYYRCYQNINMVPKKMNMNQHSNAGKEKSSKKIANRFNLKSKKTRGQTSSVSYHQILQTSSSEYRFMK